MPAAAKLRLWLLLSVLSGTLALDFAVESFSEPDGLEESFSAAVAPRKLQAPTRRRTGPSPSPTRRRSSPGGGGNAVSDAWKDVLAGFVLVCLAFPCLYFNEKRQVHMDTIFAYADRHIKDVSADAVDPENEAAIVCVQGASTTDETLRDPQFSVEVQNCAKLQRTVEMWQWQQEERTEERDGKKVTTYSYKQDWVVGPVDSGSFKESGHHNPPFPNVDARHTWRATDVSLGAFKLDESLIDQMSNWSPAHIESQALGGTMLEKHGAGVVQSATGAGGARVAPAKQEGFRGPVQEHVAHGFLDACKQEYMNGSQGAVGTFFDSIGKDDLGVLDAFESRIRDAGDRNAELQRISREWGCGGGGSFSEQAEMAPMSGNRPALGDVRVTMSKLECGKCSVASIQAGDRFQPLTYELVPSGGCCSAPPRQVDLNTAQLNPHGGDVNVRGLCSCVGAIIESGECIHNLHEEEKSGVDILALMKKNQQCVHSSLRGVGCLMFLIGDYFIFKFGGSVFTFIPWIGTYIDSLWKALALFAACLCACQCWLLTVAVSWIVLRPMKGIAMLVVAGALFAAVNILSASKGGGDDAGNSTATMAARTATWMLA